MPYRNPAVAAFVLVVLTAAAFLSVYLLVPPAPVPADAPAAVFSAERAMRHVRQLAKAPHAMGTPAHAEARAYLLQEMSGLGLAPQVQEAAAVNQAGKVAYVGYVYNLLGRLKGTGTDNKAILLMAHYDSQPNARGAGDDGAGVAAILETVRALKQGAPLDHDVIVLLTDGEEYGLYGAKAFIGHPWAKQVGVVLNLEARGNSGPSMTFEMSPENGWVARQYIAAAPYPYAGSLGYEIYRRMPNNTDFTVFKETGYTGLNAAIIGGFVHYHKATDAPENLSQRSLQHHGSNLLALTQHFGHTSLAATKAPDLVFFNFIGRWMVRYPAQLNLLWVAIATLLLVVTLRVGLRRGAVSGWQVVGGFFMSLLLLAAVVVLFIPINSMVLGLLSFTHPFNGLYSADVFFVAYLLLALGLFLLLSWLALRWLRLFSLMMGMLVLQFLMMAALYLLVPNAAYLLLFPLLFALAGVLAVFLMGLHALPVVNFRFALVLLLAALPAVFLVMPIVQVVFTVFELQLPVATVALFGLLLGLLLPLLHILERSFSWRKIPLLPLVLLVAGGITVSYAITSETPSPQRPLHSHVSYYLNADTGTAYWASAFQATDDWNRQFFRNATTGALTDVYPHAAIQYLKSAAAPMRVSAPTAEVLQDSVADGIRLLRLRLASPRQAAHLEVVLHPRQPDALQSVSLAGQRLQLQPLAGAQGPVYFTRLHGLPTGKTVLLELRLKAGVPLTLYLYDQSIGLPPALVTQPKPAHVVAEQGRESNLTVVRQVYTF
ncbi:M20/M25/M40 family metallo-hydrolase [Pontibacter sp. E15-1]|uniref:M20/M25/M40 family metallo-hydrolase n=1 Tax=Pontibacter sp. E15-1 TaxID=2919918 RepID=UPI001F4FBC51|nr:M20/M25/M40 family metallo-hydrolase [Pontibacter sp. E15-1]MCJ8165514.1 M20/M25/M40 family metallo-hydrolase [Pontibacter sp. E15-1]